MIVEERYGAFSAALHAATGAARIPVTGTLELTHRCPLTCAHCYNNLPMGDAEARRCELSTQEYDRILGEIAEAGCLWLLLTGGEILARPDFLEIYERAHARGLLTTLFTNGILITPRVADALAEARPFSIEITLYGRTRETYERLTGVPGSYDRCLRGIELLQERNLPLKLKAVAVSLNRHEISGMREFARELGVDFRFDAMMNPRIDCSQSPLAVRLRPHEIVRFDLEDPRRMEEWRRVAAEPAPSHSEQLYRCGGGVDSFAIDPYGRLSICVLSQRDQFDLRTGSFREGWEQFLFKVRSRERKLPSKCVPCGLKTMCTMCPANGELENGDPEAPVEYLCHVAHLRAHALGVPVPPHGNCEFCEGGARHAELRDSLSLLKRDGGEPRTFRRLVSLPVLAA